MSICFKNGKLVTCREIPLKCKKNQRISIPDENLGSRMRNNLVEANTVLQLLEKQNLPNKNLVTSALKSLSTAISISREMEKEFKTSLKNFSQ